MMMRGRLLPSGGQGEPRWNRYRVIKSLTLVAFVWFVFGGMYIIQEFQSNEAPNEVTVRVNVDIPDTYLINKSLYDFNNELVSFEDSGSRLKDFNTCSELCLAKEGTSPVVIGVVSCDRIGEYKSALLATTMIKSVLISSEIYGISHVEFHVFLEADSSQYFRNRLEDFGYVKKDRRNRVHVKMHFHPVLQAIPKRFQEEGKFFHNEDNVHQRCGFARLLYAANLVNVDSIIHLDTDVIITGNISQLWSFLGKMSDVQMLAVAPAVEPDSRFLYKTFRYLGLPHVKPWGLNTGVLVMNLTRMRQAGWERLVLDTYIKYSNYVDIRTYDDRLLNIFLANRRDIFVFLTCQFNYEYIHCDNGQNCKHADADPNGIGVINGAGCQFFHKEELFFKIYEYYEKFDMVHQDVRKSLMIPLREYYQNYTAAHNSKCFGSLNKLLFKNFF